MVDEKPSQTEGGETYAPRPRRSTFIRIIRTLKRRRHRASGQEDKEHAENERTMARWTRRVGVLTVVLSICAVANVFIIARQLGEMHSGGVDTHNLALAAHDQARSTGNLVSAGEQQADALNRLESVTENEASAGERLADTSSKEIGSIKATAISTEAEANAAHGQLARLDENNATARQALTTIQRAFITVDRLEETPVAGHQNTFSMQPMVQNGGNTPAIIDAYLAIDPRSEWIFNRREDIAAIITMTRTSSPPDPGDLLGSNDPIYKPMVAQWSLKNFTAGPHSFIGNVSPSAANEVGTAEVEGAMSGRGQFYYGIIKYHDVFGADHVTKYCFSINSLVIIGGVARPGGSFRCHHWNCTDDQCKADKASYDADAYEALEMAKRLGALKR